MPPTPDSFIPKPHQATKSPTKRSEAATETALQIERFYSQQILSGTLQPGARLPPNSQLTQIWETSNATVQRALAKLSSEGLIERQQGRGTFVRDKTEQSFVGVFLGPDLALDSVGFHRSLVAQIRELIETDYRAVRVYDGLTKWQTSSPRRKSKTAPVGYKTKSSLDVFKLDSRHLAFNGYIYMATSNIPANIAIDDLKPRVAFHDERRGDDVILDSIAFLEEVLSELVKRGVRKVAYMQVYGRRAPLAADLLNPEISHRIASKFPLKQFQFWDFPLQSFSESHADEVLRGGYLDAKIREKLPEAIIISDDIIARPIIFNCVRRGLSIPTDLQICVRCNDAQDVYYGEPVYRYELPIRTIAASLVDLLTKRMANVNTPEVPIKITGHFRAPEK